MKRLIRARFVLARADGNGERSDSCGEMTGIFPIDECRVGRLWTKIEWGKMAAGNEDKNMNDITKSESVDSGRVDVNVEFELRYWACKLNVAAEELRNVVQKVGPRLVDIEH